MKTRIVNCDKCRKDFIQNWVAAKNQWSQINEVSYWTEDKELNDYEKFCRSCLKGWYEKDRESFDNLVSPNKKKVFLGYKYHGALDKEDKVKKQEEENEIKAVAENYLRNEKWKDWFLERHETFLPRLDFGHGGRKPAPEQINLIDLYFTEWEKKIIGWGLSYLYMLEKFHTHCLRIAPNLSLIDFQKLCYSWWASKEKEVKHQDLVNKGRLSPEQWEKLDEFLKEKEVKEEKEKVGNFFERKLEEWLSRKVIEPNLRSFGKREGNLEKRTEILKKEDVMIRDYWEKRLEKIQDYYKKNKGSFPELDQFLEEKIKENKRRVEDWEGAIKRTDYSKWSKNIIDF